MIAFFGQPPLHLFDLLKRKYCLLRFVGLEGLSVQISLLLVTRVLGAQVEENNLHPESPVPFLSKGVRLGLDIPAVASNYQQKIRPVIFLSHRQSWRNKCK